MEWIINALQYIWMLLLSLREPSLVITIVNYGIFILALAFVVIIIRSFIVTRRCKHDPNCWLDKGGYV